MPTHQCRKEIYFLKLQNKSSYKFVLYTPLSYINDSWCHEHILYYDADSCGHTTALEKSDDGE